MTTLPTASELMAQAQQAQAQRTQQLEAQIAPVLNDLTALLREAAGRGLERLTFPLTGYTLTPEEQRLLVQRLRQAGYTVNLFSQGLTLCWASPSMTRAGMFANDTGGVRLLLREGE